MKIYKSIAKLTVKDYKEIRQKMCRSKLKK